MITHFEIYSMYVQLFLISSSCLSEGMCRKLSYLLFLVQKGSGYLRLYR